MRKPAPRRRSKPTPKSRKHNSAQKLLKSALRASEQKYRTLADAIDVGIFRSTPGPRGEFIEVNPALVRMLGYGSAAELLSTEVSQIYENPADRLEFSQKISRHGSVTHEELTLRKKDGTPCIVSETSIAVEDRRGKLLFFHGIVEDITARKKAEEELRIQKTYFERLINSAPEAIVLHDNDDIVVNINDEFTRMFGYSRVDAIGKRINELVAPAEFQEEASLLSDAVVHGNRVERDTRRKRKDGTLIDVSILGAPIFRQSEQIGVYAIYRDISERKKAEEQVLIQKTYFEKLFNSAPEAIALHGTNDCVININDEFTRLFGYSRGEAIGKPINDLVAPPELREEAVMVSQKVIRGERVELDTKRARKDGTLVDVSILGAPIVHGTQLIGDYAIYRDITERKRADDQLRIHKAYLERLFNTIPEAIVLHDNHDIIVNVNDEFGRMFGYTREESIGKHINELVAPPASKDEAQLSQKVTGGERVEYEARRRRKDGTLIDVSILSAPILSGDTQIGVYAIYKEITGRPRQT